MFQFTTLQVSEALPPMPRKRNHFMLEGPPKQESIAYVGPCAKPLPPITSAPPSHRHQQVVTPRQLYTAPAKTETLWRGNSLSQHRARSTPLDKTDYSFGPPGMTRESTHTEGEATTAETVDAMDTRQQAQADELKKKSDDGFFMTQVRLTASFT